MAKVGSRQFPYTNRGMRQAKVYSKSTGLQQEGGYASKSISTDKKGKVIIKTYEA